MVELLIEKGARKEAKDGDGNTPLILAAEEGHLDIVELLIRNGAVVDVKNGEGQTPLIKAVEWYKIDAAKLLIKMGASKDVKDKRGKTALSHAIAEPYLGNTIDFQRRKLDIVMFLLQAGAAVDTSAVDEFAAVMARQSEMCEEEKEDALQTMYKPVFEALKKALEEQQSTSS